MVKEVKAVIFDVGDVLVLGKQHSSRNAKKSNGPHEEVSKELGLTMDQYIDAVAPAYQKSARGEISYKETTEILSRNLEVSKTKLKQIYSKAYQKQFNKNEELLEKAKQLKKLGYKTAILSDQWHMSKDNVMPKKHYKYFDEVFVSCDEGMRKPEEKFFKLALNRLKVKPSEALFIDDQSWNVKKAKELGINAILFEKNEQLFKQPKWKRLK